MLKIVHGEKKNLIIEKITKIYTPLPESWLAAAGLLSKKRQSLKKHEQSIRQEWNK